MPAVVRGFNRPAQYWQRLRLPKSRIDQIRGWIDPGSVMEIIWNLKKIKQKKSADEPLA
jgi:hypothetical protein